ncbi:TlpA family protein disulfide reductase [Shewanella cyperi]|uniref:TlpA family protein disulfide reductase n=1 Tax=Shewanella cyperi TaxID=2814292 RepID=A0A975ALR7_9GAMM|nr:TlpA disulfide reductase family protein [Shewanella cyperi]QSX30513.1 TlpA family protein disulfide reductase [Shewanella cyperi]
MNRLLLSLLMLAALAGGLTAKNMRDSTTLSQANGWLKPLFTQSSESGLLIVNFWASWCAPCRREMPMLDGLYRNGMPVLGYSMDEDRFLADEFLRRYPVTFPNLIGQATEANPIQVFPTTVIINPQGQPLYVHQGELDETSLLNAWQKLKAESEVVRP